MRPEELRRRRTAFTTLLVSTLFGLLLAARLLFGVGPLVFGISFGTIAAVFYSLRVLFERSLKALSQVELNLSERRIERLSQGFAECYDIDAIRSTRLKRTTEGGIREIKITLAKGRSLVVRKPLSVVHGSQYRRLDAVGGIVLLCAAVGIYLLSRNI